MAAFIIPGAMIAAGVYDETTHYLRENTDTSFPSIWDGRTYPVNLITFGNRWYGGVNYLHDTIGIAANDPMVLVLFGIIVFLVLFTLKMFVG